MSAASETGLLWGVGVGPGDPELLTLKAARVLRESPVVAFFAKRGCVGNARTIADSFLNADREELRFEYPFTVEVPATDASYQSEMSGFYDICAGRIAEPLTAGLSVAVLCEGDPFFYGSFMYLHDRLAARFAVRAIAGITGMSGCWAAAALPMTHGDDTLAVLPGTLDEAVLAQKLAETDAAAIMKVGRNLPKIRHALDEAGLLDRAVYVERGTMADERIEPLAVRDPEKPAPYFSMVLVPGRRGVR